MPLNPPTSYSASGFRDGFFPGTLQEPWVTGRYYLLAGPVGSPSTSVTLGVGTARAVPFYVPNNVTATKIGAEITLAGDAGSKYRLVIYNDSGLGRPGTVLLDAGTIAGDSATVQEITIAQALPPGLYWGAGIVQVVTVTQPTVRIGGQPFALGVDIGTALPTLSSAYAGRLATGIAGAAPTWVDAGTSGSQPRIFVKV